MVQPTSFFNHQHNTMVESAARPIHYHEKMTTKSKPSKYEDQMEPLEYLSHDNQLSWQKSVPIHDRRNMILKIAKILRSLKYNNCHKPIDEYSKIKLLMISKKFELSFFRLSVSFMEYNNMQTLTHRVNSAYTKLKNSHKLQKQQEEDIQKRIQQAKLFFNQANKVLSKNSGDFEKANEYYKKGLQLMNINYKQQRQLNESSSSSSNDKLKERQIQVYSESLGLRFHHGSDGYIRVVAFMKDGHQRPLITRTGNVYIDDVVREVVGIDLRNKPLSTKEWDGIISIIKTSPRPMTLILSQEQDEIKSQPTTPKDISKQLKAKLEATLIEASETAKTNERRASF